MFRRIISWMVPCFIRSLWASTIVEPPVSIARKALSRKSQSSSFLDTVCQLACTRGSITPSGWFGHGRGCIGAPFQRGSVTIRFDSDMAPDILAQQQKTLAVNMRYCGLEGPRRTCCFPLAVSLPNVLSSSVRQRLIHWGRIHAARTL